MAILCETRCRCLVHSVCRRAAAGAAAQPVDGGGQRADARAGHQQPAALRAGAPVLTRCYCCCCHFLTAAGSWYTGSCKWVAVARPAVAGTVVIQREFTAKHMHCALCKPPALRAAQLRAASYTRLYCLQVPQAAGALTCLRSHLCSRVPGCYIASMMHGCFSGCLVSHVPLRAQLSSHMVLGGAFKGPNSQLPSITASMRLVGACDDSFGGK